VATVKTDFKVDGLPDLTDVLERIMIPFKRLGTFCGRIPDKEPTFHISEWTEIQQPIPFVNIDETINIRGGGN
jgi:hypothetical protein